MKARLPRFATPRLVRFVLSEPSVPLGVEPLTPAPRTGIDYPTAWARRAPARALRRAVHEVVMEPVVQTFARPRTQGEDRLATLDAHSPVVFAANHSSHADTPVLLRTLPKPWRDKLFVGAAADYFFPNRLAGTASALLLNAIPIERTKVTRRSALDAAGLIDAGWSMLIYPEGGRSPDGWGQPFRGGAAYLAIRCAVPIVPIHVKGTAKVLPKGRNWPTVGRVTVTFGDPMMAAEGEDTRTLAARLEATVAALADEVETDWWQARRRFHAGQSPTLSGPETVAWRRSWALTARDAHGTDDERRPWPPRGRTR